MAKHSLGAISFGRVCLRSENAAGFVSLNIMGKERVELLKRAVRGEALPEGVMLIAQNGGGGYERVTNEVFREEDIEYYNLRGT